MNKFPVLLILVLWLFAPAQASSASDRHALVIGNSAYGGSFDLINPRSDSEAIASTLSSLGYRVHGGGAQFDLTLDALNDTIDIFLSSVKDGSSTFIYYAGHGAAASGSNYLIPILPEGVILKSDADIRDRSVSLQSILERVETSNPTGINVLFFDACRDAPVDNISRSINFSGLTTLDTARQPRGSFVGFSTEYGDVALDGDRAGNSPFAAAVLNSLKNASTVPIELFYKDVVNQVYDATNGQQFPIAESKIRGRPHCIVDCEETTAPNTANNFGTLSVNTIPMEAIVCYRIDGWESANCGPQMVLPLNQDITVTVSAKGYRPITTLTRLTDTRQQIRIELEKSRKSNLRIIGGVAAAVIAAGLLLSRDNGSDNETYSITVNPPQ